MADISSLQSVQSNHEKYKDLFKNSGKNDTISDTVSKGTLHTMTEALGYVGKEVTVKVLGDDGKFTTQRARSSRQKCRTATLRS